MRREKEKAEEKKCAAEMGEKEEETEGRLERKS